MVEAAWHYAGAVSSAAWPIKGAGWDEADLGRRAEMQRRAQSIAKVEGQDCRKKKKESER